MGIFYTVGNQELSDKCGIQAKRLVEKKLGRQHQLNCLRDRVKRMLGCEKPDCVWEFLCDLLEENKTITEKEFDWVGLQSGLFEELKMV